MSHVVPPPVRGLFQRNIPGDDALVGLAALRFGQEGMGAELYAESTRELERLLRFVPQSEVLPTVHLDRRIDVLTYDGRQAITAFQRRFAGQIAGVVVHDRPTMADRLDATATALRELGGTSGNGPVPSVYLEFANGLSPAQFVALAELISDVEQASMCVDVGHLGIQQARSELSRRLGTRGAPSLFDPDLAQDISPVADAVGSALGAVTTLIDALGQIDKTVHVHLHDGHPLTSGVADHRGFLTRVPIPFSFDGRSSLPQLYGPRGLSEILVHAQRMKAQPSYTLEIHRVEGRLPLQDAQPMFAHWTDLTNAERVNYWLAVLAENHTLAVELLRSAMVADSSPGDDHAAR
jgi:hypothetical protein